MIPWARAARRGHFGADKKLDQGALLKRDQVIFEMWPEGFRRTGVPVHEFPIGVIKRWQQEMGRPN